MTALVLKVYRAVPYHDMPMSKLESIHSKPSKLATPLILFVLGISVPASVGHPALQKHTNTSDGTAQDLEDQKRNHEPYTGLAFVADPLEPSWNGHPVIEIDGDLQLARIRVELLSPVDKLARPGLQ